MTVGNEAFLDLEFSLARSLSRAFDRQTGDTLERDLRLALEKGDFEGAHRLVANFTYIPTIETTRGIIDQNAVSAFLLGQSFFTGGDVNATSVGSGSEPLPVEVQSSAQAFSSGQVNTGPETMRLELENIVAFVEANPDAAATLTTREVGQQTLQKAVIPGLGGALNRAVSSGKQASFGLGANLNTSRLATFGAIRQMRAQGVTRFQRTAILDERTCPVCRALHGTSFTLTNQEERLTSMLLTEDPKELASQAPFPKQNLASLDSMAAMSVDDLVARGFDLPPSHPFCRCIIVPVGTVPTNQILGPSALRIPRAILQEQFSTTADVSKKLGLLDQLGTGTPKPFPVSTPTQAPAPTTTTTGVVNPNGKSTEEVFRTADGSWTAPRATLHKEIREDALEGAVAQEQPVFHMLGGGSGAGKSSVAESGLAKLPDNIVKVDSDAIKTKLPEFNTMIKAGDERAAAFVHEESSFLAKEIMRDGSDLNYNVLLDGTGDGGWESLNKKVTLFRERGYQIKADYVTIPTDEAVARATARAERTGRVVPESAIRGIHKNVSQTFKEGVDNNVWDEVNLWDNNVPQGSDPILVFTMKDGVQTIHNETLWKEFLAKADETF